MPSPETIVLKLKVSACVSSSIPTASALSELWPTITCGVPVRGVKMRRLEGLER